MGRPRKVGKRLPTLKARVDASKTTWQTITIEGWYGGRTCDRLVVSLRDESVNCFIEVEHLLVNNVNNVNNCNNCCCTLVFLDALVYALRY